MQALTFSTERLMSTHAQRSWWADAIGYEIYIRSYNDGNGDGVGDFAGLTERLDHLAELGVDVIWVTPFYPSPMVDFGYDVASFIDVDPLFGSLTEFDRCLARAHELGLKVIIDMVPNHTSDQHPWFVDAVSSVDAAKRDWYLWRDPAPDGGPPNNWVTHFGGPAWTFDSASGQYYCHLFLPEQPDLNWRNPDVQRAFKDILTFWLDRGVDGFRIDVTQGLVKDATFRSNPELRPLTAGMSRLEQWDSFDHERDILQSETLDVFRDWRQLCDSRDALLVGETYVLDAAALRHFLEPNDGIHIGFWFQTMHIDWEPAALRSVLADPHREAGAGVGWVMSSHDDPRAPGRFGGGVEGAERARGLFTLLSMMPGLPFLYMGDELGLSDGVVEPDRFVDPVVFRTGVKSDNRDGCRTPMPWQAGSPMFGFTSLADGWLPHGERVDADTVSAQSSDPSSSLTLMQRLLHVRRPWIEAELASANEVSFAPVDPATPAVIRFDRGPFRCALNTADDMAVLPVSSGSVVEYRSLPGSEDEAVMASGGSEISLRPREAVIVRLG